MNDEFHVDVFWGMYFSSVVRQEGKNCDRTSKERSSELFVQLSTVENEFDCELHLDHMLMKFCRNLVDIFFSEGALPRIAKGPLNKSKKTRPADVVEAGLVFLLLFSCVCCA